MNFISYINIGLHEILFKRVLTVRVSLLHLLLINYISIIYRHNLAATYINRHISKIVTIYEYNLKMHSILWLDRF